MIYLRKYPDIFFLLLWLLVYQWWLLFKPQSFQTKLVNIPENPADSAADTHYP